MSILPFRFRFARDQRGSVGIIFALVAVPVFAFVGLAIDYGRALNARFHLQQAADTAALAAASEPDMIPTERAVLAQRIFTQNRRGNADIADVVAAIEEDADATDTVVVVKASKPVKTSFAGVLGVTTLPIEVEAKAQVGIAGGALAPACLLALEPNDYGIKINGGGTGSHLSANCGVYANSQSSRAIFGNDKGSITSAHTCVHGDYDRSPTYSPKPVNGCVRIADPLAGLLSAPPTSGCDFNNAKVNSGRTRAFTPGVYCGGIDIGSDAVVTFAPGTYVIKNGQFKIGSHAKASGDGVFFYLIGNNSRFLWTSHAEVTFKAPTSGDYKGMLLWSDEAHSNAHEFGCHAQSVMQGAVYSPQTEVQIGSSGDVGASADWTVWVVKSIEMSSHAHLKIMSNHASSSTPMPDGLLTRLTPQTKRAVLK